MKTKQSWLTNNWCRSYSTGTSGHRELVFHMLSWNVEIYSKLMQEIMKYWTWLEHSSFSCIELQGSDSDRDSK